ncbi:MAG: hypothetical protein JO214_00590 [Frankiaceae bacterium]|nr:hypothetical protein [Frankiaceae bacterium]
MDLTDLDTARELMGDGIPSKGGLPAAWWLSADADMIAAFDRWLADYKAHVEKIGELAATIGLTAEDGYISTWGKRTDLMGFRVPTIALGIGSPPPPAGWRIDRQSSTPRLVPSRKTKADREGPVAVAFRKVSRLPNVRNYVTGLPDSLYLDDRGWGGTEYPVHYRRGEACVWAYCGGDPDRQSEDQKKRREFSHDADLWTRMPLSVLAKLQEEKAERIEASA